MKTSNKILTIAAALPFALVLFIVLVLRFAFEAAPDAESDRASGRTVITRDFPVTGFTAVDINGNWKLVIVPADSFRVRVRAPEYLMDGIQVGQSGNTIYLRSPLQKHRKKDNVRAEVFLPELEKISSSGGSLIRFSDFTLKSLTLDISGANRIRGTDNTIESLALSSTGASRIDLSDSRITNADLRVNGAVSVKLTMAGGDLTGEASGAASIVYEGEINSQTIRTRGLNSKKINTWLWSRFCVSFNLLFRCLLTLLLTCLFKKAFARDTSPALGSV